MGPKSTSYPYSDPSDLDKRQMTEIGSTAFSGLISSGMVKHRCGQTMSLIIANVYTDVTFKSIQGSQSLKVLINNLDRNFDARKTSPRTDRTKSGIPVFPTSFSPELVAVLQQIEDWKVEFKSEPYNIDVEGEYIKLPSWVPDWSVSLSNEIIPRYKQAELYAAAGTTRTVASLVNESVLTLRGIEVDTVKFTSQIMAYTSGAYRSDLFTDWKTFAIDSMSDSTGDGCDSTKALPSHSAFSSSAEDAFWHTLCGDTIVKNAGFQRATAHNYHDFLSWCQTHEPGLLPVSSTTAEYTSALSVTPPAQTDIHSDVLTMESAVRAATTMRRLFVTEKGRLGLGPAQTVGREKIFVLQGGKMPFVLRSKKAEVGDLTGECYEVVGDCYVHGLMDGEALKLGLLETEVLLV